MKLLLLLGIVLFAAWLWRHNRVNATRQDTPARPPSRPAPGPAQLEMVRCAVCGLHVPAGEAVTTAVGTYCGDVHRRQAER